MSDWRKLRPEDYETLYYEFDMKPTELCQKADLSFYLDAWCRMKSPWSRAHALLQSLDIGPDLTGADGTVGGLEFIDGPFPGSDYLGVHCYDDISISLLQARLVELGENIEVRVFTGANDAKPMWFGIKAATFLLIGHKTTLKTVLLSRVEG